jgi:diadenosine tetraphosphate (Ap4A) HIT family hydrolase
MNVCHLCAQAAGRSEGDLLAQTAERSQASTVAANSANFCLIASIGPVTVGHALIVPKGHVMRMAGLPAPVRSEYESFKQAVRRAMSEEFRAPVHLFEHGGDAAGEVSPCTVSHAHLHAVPADCEVKNRLPRRVLWQGVSTLDDIELAVGASEYLFYEDPSGAAVVAGSDGASFPSQILRRLFVEQLRPDTDWNWRSDPRPAVLRETMARLAALCIDRSACAGHRIHHFPPAHTPSSAATADTPRTPARHSAAGA